MTKELELEDGTSIKFIKCNKLYGLKGDELYILKIKKESSCWGISFNEKNFIEFLAKLNSM